VSERAKEGEGGGGERERKHALACGGQHDSVGGELLIGYCDRHVTELVLAQK
jgi:hypothetical protein